MSNTITTTQGIGLGGASFLVLLVLKVMGLIDMHWFWILTSVLWVPVAAFSAVMLMMFVVMVLVALVASVFSWIVGNE